MMINKIKRRLNVLKGKKVLVYAFSMAAILLVLQLLEYKFVLIDHAFEVYIFFIAILFTCLGIWLSLKLVKPKLEIHVEKIVEEKLVYVNPNIVDAPSKPIESDKMGISSRELEVLQLMSNGLSNQEIANQLFVSVNTVKTHTSNLFEKMEVKRRTQAIEKAKRLRII